MCFDRYLGRSDCFFFRFCSSVINSLIAWMYHYNINKEPTNQTISVNIFLSVHIPIHTHTHTHVIDWWNKTARLPTKWPLKTISERYMLHKHHIREALAPDFVSIATHRLYTMCCVCVCILIHRWIDSV